METASVDDEMIALAPVDGSESPTQTLREPAITSINRLAAYAALDRGAIAPLGNSANSSDSGLGNPASGMPTPIQTIRPQAATASSQATTLFKSLAPELDKFKQTGSSQIQLDLPVGDQESVRIKLSLRGGEIRSTFITESPELREALQKAWPDFSQNSRDRGYRLGDPAFQQGFQENNANLGENNRRQPDNRTYETGEAFATTSLRKVTSNRSTTSQSPSTALWA
jgi:flagellar hook-length control protein FliK